MISTGLKNDSTNNNYINLGRGTSKNCSHHLTKEKESKAHSTIIITSVILLLLSSFYSSTFSYFAFLGLNRVVEQHQLPLHQAYAQSESSTGGNYNYTASSTSASLALPPPPPSSDLQYLGASNVKESNSTPGLKVDKNNIDSNTDHDNSKNMPESNGLEIDTPRTLFDPSVLASIKYHREDTPTSTPSVTQEEAEQEPPEKERDSPEHGAGQETASTTPGTPSGTLLLPFDYQPAGSGQTRSSALTSGLSSISNFSFSNDPDVATKTAGTNTLAAKMTMTQTTKASTKPELGSRNTTNLSSSSPSPSLSSSISSAAQTSCQKASISGLSSSGYDAGNPPGNAIDNNLATQWSSSIPRAFIQADLGLVKTLCNVSIAWYKGDLRQYLFSISVSKDGVNFQTVLVRYSNGATLQPENYDIADTDARYVRITVYGNTANSSAGITELAFFALVSTPPPPPTPINKPPVVDSKTVTTSKNTAIQITLTGSDPDSGDILTFSVVDLPSHGSLVSGSEPNSVEYSPNADYVGSDSFTYTAQDNHGAVSNKATVSITVQDTAVPPPSPAPQPSSTTNTGTSIGFSGLSQGQIGISYYPPDVQVAAGPNHLMEMTNLQGGIFTKLGESISIFSLYSFFKVSSSDDLSDPRIMYDALSGRWFAAIADITTNSILVAVSTGSDPTSTFRIFSATFSDCPDYPSIGLNSDKFAISANIFSSNCTGSYTGVQYFIISKSYLIGTSSAVVYSRSTPNTSIFSLQPAQSLSTDPTLYMVTVNDDASNYAKVYYFSSAPSSSSSTPTKVVNYPIHTTHIPPNAIQKGSTNRIDTADARALDAAWYKGILWTTFNDACTPSGDTQTRSCIRLIQVDTNSNSKLQDFDLGAKGGTYYFYPALRIDSAGNLLVVFGGSSADIYPSIFASGQDASGGAMDSSALTLRSGMYPETTSRFGDYFGAGVDPSNPSLVWSAGEYHTSNPWSTFVATIFRR